MTVAAAALALTAAGATAGAGQAQAASVWSNGWDTYSAAIRCTVGSDEATLFCLYYSPGANGAVWTTNYDQTNFRATYPTGFSWEVPKFRSDRYGSAGAGQQVLRDAASAENGTSHANLAVFSGLLFNGDVTWIPPGRGGNLSSYLRNKNESAQLYY
ncbi:hypothetical protein ACFWA9_38385 [Kitasatospora sp. NPDC059973]|uniref:hypothetical protein n=1 Tax=Kitasatospora sp. NPDC059973 TaxID=3347020 RepID=UPI0036751D24